MERITTLDRVRQFWHEHQHGAQYFTTREIARALRSPISAVASACQQLKREGHLFVHRKKGNANVWAYRYTTPVQPASPNTSEDNEDGEVWRPALPSINEEEQDKFNTLVEAALLAYGEYPFDPLNDAETVHILEIWIPAFIAGVCSAKRG